MKQRICIIAINDRWNTQFIHILREECDVMFQFKVNILSILPKTVEISHEWVLKIFKYQEPEFYARLLMRLKKFLLKFLHVLWMLL